MRNILLVRYVFAEGSFYRHLLAYNKKTKLTSRELILELKSGELVPLQYTSSCKSTP